MTGLTRRGLLGLTGAAAIGAGLSACTGAAPTGTPGGSGSGGSNTLRLFTYEDDTTIGLLRDQVKAFDQANGTTTAVDSLPGSGAAVFPDKLRTELLGGSGPDIWRIWGGQIGAPFAEAQQALDLTPYYQQYGWDSRINTAAIEGMTFDGVRAGVPFSALGLGAWYNRAAFEEAGVEGPPTSYAELEEVNARLLGSGMTPLATGGKYGWHIMRLFEYLLETAAGPELHDQLLVGGESWDRPEVVTAFTNFKKWQDEGWLPDGAVGLDPADVEPGYVQGRQAYTITGPWTEAQAIQSAGADSADFGVFALPTDHEPQRHSGFVEGYMVNARSGNPDKAAALLDFILQPEAQQAMKIGASTVEGAEPDPQTQPLAAEWAQGQGQQPFYTIQDQAFPKQQADQYFAIQSDVLQGRTSPADAAKRMQEVVSTWAQD
ncbi:ABC transporter substrate-binding protein [Desertihabitans aurantiacus]|uniref:ABC transporter substrate-binding protein n=1 Tax=Desertihabitans aurantiacus TaxID=2282477 RepID=UPI000DF7CEBD|nr:extracellular solute-binding protein [Desertihabitans aurantiacus]